MGCQKGSRLSRPPTGEPPRRSQPGTLGSSAPGRQRRPRSSLLPAFFASSTKPRGKKCCACLIRNKGGKIPRGKGREGAGDVKPSNLPRGAGSKERRKGQWRRRKGRPGANGSQPPAGAAGRDSARVDTHSPWTVRSHDSHLRHLSGDNNDVRSQIAIKRMRGNDPPGQRTTLSAPQ